MFLLIKIKLHQFSKFVLIVWWDMKMSSVFVQFYGEIFDAQKEFKPIVIF